MYLSKDQVMDIDVPVVLNIPLRVCLSFNTDFSNTRSTTHVVCFTFKMVTLQSSSNACFLHDYVHGVWNLKNWYY